MGTNYFLGKPCPTCGHQKSMRHIGKSSAGWCFSLHVYPEDGIHDLAHWLGLFQRHGDQIADEYGNSIHPLEMVQIICCRSWPNPISWTRGEWVRNKGVPGPNNLARHEIDHQHCIGHGSGTWDLVVGDFS